MYTRLNKLTIVTSWRLRWSSAPSCKAAFSITSVASRSMAGCCPSCFQTVFQGSDFFSLLPVLVPAAKQPVPCLVIDAEVDPWVPCHNIFSGFFLDSQRHQQSHSPRKNQCLPFSGEVYFSGPLDRQDQVPHQGNL